MAPFEFDLFDGIDACFASLPTTPDDSELWTLSSSRMTDIGCDASKEAEALAAKEDCPPIAKAEAADFSPGFFEAWSDAAHSNGAFPPAACDDWSTSSSLLSDMPLLEEALGAPCGDSTSPPPPECPPSKGRKARSAPRPRNWTCQQTHPAFEVDIFVKSSRQRAEEFSPHMPEEMYSHPYMNNLRMVVTLKGPLVPVPWGTGDPHYSLRLVEADTLAGDQLPRALAGDGVTGKLVQDFNLTRHVWQREGRFWIEKGYISYHFHNKQFRIVALLHTDARVWATYVSAPFTILAKRKERVHGYNAAGAKWKRAMNNEARRRVKAKSLAQNFGLNEEEARQADAMLLSLTTLKAAQQQYVMHLWSTLQ